MMLLAADLFPLGRFDSHRSTMSSGVHVSASVAMSEAISDVPVDDDGSHNAMAMTSGATTKSQSIANPVSTGLLPAEGCEILKMAGRSDSHRSTVASGVDSTAVAMYGVSDVPVDDDGSHKAMATKYGAAMKCQFVANPLSIGLLPAEGCGILKMAGAAGLGSGGKSSSLAGVNTTLLPAVRGIEGGCRSKDSVAAGRDGHARSFVHHKGGIESPIRRKGNTAHIKADPIAVSERIKMVCSSCALRGHNANNCLKKGKSTSAGKSEPQLLLVDDKNLGKLELSTVANQVEKEVQGASHEEAYKDDVLGDRPDSPNVCTFPEKQKKSWAEICMDADNVQNVDSTRKGNEQAGEVPVASATAVEKPTAEERMMPVKTNASSVNKEDTEDSSSSDITNAETLQGRLQVLENRENAGRGRSRGRGRGRERLELISFKEEERRLTERLLKKVMK